MDPASISIDCSANPCSHSSRLVQKTSYDRNWKDQENQTGVEFSKIKPQQTSTFQRKHNNFQDRSRIILQFDWHDWKREIIGQPSWLWASSLTNLARSLFKSIRKSRSWNGRTTARQHSELNCLHTYLWLYKIDQTAEARSFQFLRLTLIVKNKERSRAFSWTITKKGEKGLKLFLKPWSRILWSFKLFEDKYRNR